MKKIFLTSGLVLCMACPAFAADPGDHTVANIADTNNESVGPASCVEGVLETSTAGATVNFGAMWTANYNTISLDVSTADGAATGTSVNPTQIFGINGDTSDVYTRSGTGDNDANDPYVFSAMNSLNSSPAGKSVSVTLMGNAPSGTPTVTTPSAVNRPFAGFYDSSSASIDQTAQNHANQYIDGDGAPTSAGTTAAGGYTAGSSHTWYARYDCADFSITDPTLDGYTFAGWYDAETGGNQVTDFCFNNNTTLYAHWTENSINITWDGGVGGSTPSGGDTSCTYNTNFAIPATPTRTGYTFAGWDVTSVTSASSGSGSCDPLTDANCNQNELVP